MGGIFWVYAFGKAYLKRVSFCVLDIKMTAQLLLCRRDSKANLSVQQKGIYGMALTMILRLARFIVYNCIFYDFKTIVKR